MGVQINGDTGNISATKADYSGNVTIGGTLTYEDVTNIDSVGLVTARSGIEVGARPGVAASISVDGNAIFSGITTVGGDVKVGSGITLSPDGNIFATGISTFGSKLGIGGIIPSNALDVQGGTSNTAIVARSTDAKAQISLLDNSTTSVGSVVIGAEGDALFFTSGSSGTERLRIDSSGRLLLGTTTEGHAAADNFTIEDSGNSGITIRSGTTNNGTIYFSDGTSGSAEYRGAVIYNHNENYLRFYTNGTEKFRINSTGDFGLGTTDPTDADSGDGGFHVRPSHSNGAPQAAFKRAASGNLSTCIVFVDGNVGRGSITYNDVGTSYNTSSDYRLKENVVAISDGITRLKTLKPSRFNFKGNKDKTVDGFLAHEVTAVPEATTGTKDEVDSNNKPVYQELDQAKLVPLLTAALQETIAKIETLETEVAALKSQLNN